MVLFLVTLVVKIKNAGTVVIDAATTIVFPLNSLDEEKKNQNR